MDIAEVASDDVPAAQADPNLQIGIRLPFNQLYLGINRAKPPFDKQEVRQASGHGHQQGGPGKGALRPTASVAKEFIPPGIFGYTKDLVDWPYDPKQGQGTTGRGRLPQRLQDQVVGHDQSRVGYCTDPNKVGQVIQSDLKKVGIDAEFVTYDWAVYLDKVAAGEADMFLLGWMADYQMLRTSWIFLRLRGRTTALVPRSQRSEPLAKAACRD